VVGYLVGRHVADVCVRRWLLVFIAGGRCRSETQSGIFPPQKCDVDVFAKLGPSSFVIFFAQHAQRSPIQIYFFGTLFRKLVLLEGPSDPSLYVIVAPVVRTRRNAQFSAGLFYILVEFLDFTVRGKRSLWLTGGAVAHVLVRVVLARGALASPLNGAKLQIVWFLLFDHVCWNIVVKRQVLCLVIMGRIKTINVHVCVRRDVSVAGWGSRVGLNGGIDVGQQGI